ncbi:MAG: hypothetical protein ACI89J_002232 [Hyphomicrobiaceae bacterium]|jgi:hypothetical protein
MKTLGLAMVASLALAIGAGAANAAEAPATIAKTTTMHGMSGIQLPRTQKAAKPAEIVVAKRRRGRRVGAGLAIGALIIGGAIIASEQARADRRRVRRNRRNCRTWLRRCNRGNDRACWRHDNRC